eukprot:3282188-Pyramimonas_sp.AAC.1
MLTAGQCAFDLDGGVVHLNLGFTKGGKRSGTAERVTIDELETVVLLAELLQGCPAGTQLCPRGAGGFR